MFLGFRPLLTRPVLEEGGLSSFAVVITDSFRLI